MSHAWPTPSPRCVTPSPAQCADVTDLPRGARVGVDVGTVRVGVAASDPDGIMATPVETVPRDATGAEPPADVRRIVEIVHERGAVVVYVGLPRHLSGTEGSASAAVRTYCVALARAVAPVPVRLIDERMSTVSAHRSLYASGRAGRRHREVVDQAAAVVILQSAIDGERAAGERRGEVVMSERMDRTGGTTQTEGSA
ncbi:MAG: Holliday junction resolvase RuvX [Cellulomonadaceae bacterium]|nr:Holliday junction resolvase RuvX [Cellulomonadaceae bacterium]